MNAVSSDSHHEISANNLNDSFLNIFSVTRGLKAISLNINSLTKHVDELKILLHNSSIDIVSLNETKLDNSISDTDIHIPGYHILRRDRNRHGVRVRE